MVKIPDDFEPIFRTSPYTELIGPIYQKKVSSELIVAIRAEEKHCNARGTVHGGVLASLEDIALGYNAAFSTEPATQMVTASQTIDYAGKAEKGDWIEIRTDVQKVGRSMAFANCYFHVKSKRIARASAVFTVVGSW